MFAFFILSNCYSFKLVDVKQFEEKILINALLNSITKEFTTYDILKKQMSNNSQSQVETNYLSLLPKQQKPIVLSLSKFKTLQDLKLLIPVLPIDYRIFYDNLEPLINYNLNEWQFDNMKKQKCN